MSEKRGTPAEQIAIWGLGHIGLKTARYLLECTELQVIGLDIRQDRLERTLHLRHFRDAALRGRFSVSAPEHASIRQCSTHFVCVNALTAPDGEQDLAAVMDVCGHIGAAIHGPDNLLVVRSTLLPGTAANVASALSKATSCKADAHCDVVVNPSFARESEYEEDLKTAARIVIGACDFAVAEKLRRVYNLPSGSTTVVSTTSAELTKYVDNAYHALKVSFANEVSRLADNIGADGREVMRIVCADDRLNISSTYLSPGGPYGGACLPKDMSALVSWALRRRVNASLLEGVIESNNAHASRFQSASVPESSEIPAGAEPSASAVASIKSDNRWMADVGGGTKTSHRIDGRGS